jgi:hypothetical protein
MLEGIEKMDSFSISLMINLTCFFFRQKMLLQFPNCSSVLAITISNPSWHIVPISNLANTTPILREKEENLPNWTVGS